MDFMPKAEGAKSAEDPIVLKLEVDHAARVWGYQLAWFFDPCCWLPGCAVISNAVCCSTLYMLVCFPTHEKIVADAHVLTLCENSLRYEVSAHTSYRSVHTMALRHQCEYTCTAGGQMLTICDPGGVCGERGLCGTSIEPYTRVIRLADVESVSVLSGNAPNSVCAGECPLNIVGPDELIVTSKKGNILAAVAGPRDAEAFLRAFAKQKHAMEAQGSAQPDAMARA